MLTKDSARCDPYLGDNRNHPSPQQRTANLTEHNVYVSRTDWSVADETKIAQIQELRESLEQCPSL